MQKHFNTLIPPQPEILISLARAFQAEDPDQRQIADLLRKDVALYSMILKAANSPYYGLAVEITSVERALSLLGFQRIFSLVRLTLMKNSLQKTGRMERFWDTAQDVSELSTVIAQRLTRLNKDDVYTCGMLHDCGLPLMVQGFDNYRDFLLKNGNLSAAELEQAETQQFGFSHYRVGARMAERWLLPQYIADTIRLQPQIDAVLEDRIEVADHTRELLCVLTLAQDISEAYRYYWRISPKQELSRLQPALAHLGIVDLDYLNLKDEILEGMGA
ncbi:HDOD domain-containing protein [Marinobacterium lutimaris]|uniref:HDOD domain-containing protein n=1 Tax=Marinobacterium lutimaris TaxID=568106 RepID=A0A1H6D230_9GAMM|nr:HDOD domain-containing protein [Marinobacterium lutimaris]SEG79320.1 HDOD domain-containing protein [Marinobacterium lutimaris]